jgi:hypothetical protein
MMRKGRRGQILGLALALFFISFSRADESSCESALYPVAATTVHRYHHPASELPFAISMWMPAPPPGQEAKFSVENIHSYRFGDPLPSHFILGNGGSLSAFYEVDLRESSPLEPFLKSIDEDLEKKGLRTSSDRLEYLRNFAHHARDWPPPANAATLNLSPEEERFRFQSRDWLLFQKAYHAEKPGDYFPTERSFPAVRLENLVFDGASLCIQKALLTSILLHRWKIPHRLINGATWYSPYSTVGHTWISLADGRILDPEWNLLEVAKISEGFVEFGGAKRIVYETYPLLVHKESK